MYRISELDSLDCASFRKLQTVQQDATNYKCSRTFGAVDGTVASDAGVSMSGGSQTLPPLPTLPFESLDWGNTRGVKEIITRGPVFVWSICMDPEILSILVGVQYTGIPAKEKLVDLKACPLSSNFLASLCNCLRSWIMCCGKSCIKGIPTHWSTGADAALTFISSRSMSRKALVFVGMLAKLSPVLILSNKIHS